jgi:hypothetical protein
MSYPLLTDAVEFSKLFLLPDMAHYTKFDLTCDASALLGIIININTFPQNVRIDAENVSWYCTCGKETKYLVLEVMVMVCFIGGRNRRNRRPVSH